jgi:hypothetical protein
MAPNTANRDSKSGQGVSETGQPQTKNVSPAKGATPTLGSSHPNAAAPKTASVLGTGSNADLLVQNSEAV